MNIKSLRIKNYKSIKNIKIDFFNNKNGIDAELKLGTFKLTPDKKYAIPAFNVIVGRNAIGKSTIIEAIGLVVTVINRQILDVIKQRILQKNMVKKINSERYKIDSIMNDNFNLIKNIEKGINNSKSPYFQLWQNEKRDFFRSLHEKDSYSKNSDIEIQINIFDTKLKDQEIKLIINKEGYIDINYTKDANEEMIKRINNFVIKIQKPFNSFPIDKSVDLVSDIRSSVNSNVMLTRCILVLENGLGKEKLLNLLQLADPSIKKIIMLKQSNGTKLIEKIVLDHGEINISNLSTGTKHFIVLLHMILLPYLLKKEGKKTQDGLIVIDELELSIHNELADVLKMLMIEMFDKFNISYIFTTHNPLILKNIISNKQIITLDYEDDTLTSKKISSILKPHNSIIKAYEVGLVATYPDPDRTRRISSHLLELDE